MRTSPALHFTHDASQHSSFIKAPVLTRHKTVTHSDRPVCSYVRQYFSQRLPFCGKNPQLNRNLTKFFPATLLAGESLEPLIELQSPCSNTAASMGFYRTAPPLDTKICTAAALLPRNWVSFQEYPPFHKRDSVTGSTANSQGLQIWFSRFSLSTLCCSHASIFWVHMS